MKIIDKYIDDSNVVAIFPFGSHVYGTATPESDEDYIIVAKQWFDSNDINIHVYTVEQYDIALKRCDIQILECAFCPINLIWKINPDIVTVYDKYLNIDKNNLRKSISTITSNSWVKGKKKLLVSGDYDVNLAIKSVFHSLRILDYGIQIASSNTIQDWGSMNYVLADLKKLAEQFQHDDLWYAIDTKYRKVFNEKSTLFKQLAPKDLFEKDNKVQLIKILKDYAIVKENFNDEDYDAMINEILNLFNK